MSRLLWRCLSALLVSLAFCAHTSVASASTPSDALASLSFNTTLGTNWAFADFDGDQQPDLAQSRSLAHGKHRVEVRLSRLNQAHSFALKNPDSLELQLDAVDVDGDRDLDLVISGRYFGQRIGVWINDGKGSFSKDSSNAYPDAFGHVYVYASRPEASNTASITKSPRLQGLTSVRFAAPRSANHAAVANTRFTPFSLLRSGAHPLRAPPNQLN